MDGQSPRPIILFASPEKFPDTVRQIPAPMNMKGGGSAAKDQIQAPEVSCGSLT